MGSVVPILLIIAGFGTAGAACVYGATHGWPVWVLPLAAVWSASAFIYPLVGMGYARVSIDPRTREVVLSRVRWPLRSVVKAFPLTRVTDAVVRVDEDPNADATRYMVFLVVEGEAPLPLVEGLWVPGRAGLDKVAAEVRALLGK
jgi:hypothetical protein